MAAIAPHPHPPPEARPRLEARLQRALGASLALFVAAHGYGKTAALARLAELDSRRAIWYRSSDDASPVLAELSGADGEPRLLLVDEVQNLAPTDLDQLMQRLCTRLPRGWSAAVASTAELDQRDVSGLLARGDAVYLDEHDLRLDREEARAIASAAGQGVAAADAAWARASGWPLGVIAILDGREAWLTDYFLLRVLEPLAARTRRFLEASLVLDSVTSVTVDACRAVSQANDATQLLAYLAANHVFLGPTAPQQVGYLPIFRSTILDVLRQRRQAVLVRWATRASQYLLEQADPVDALRVLGVAGDWSAALELLRGIAPGAVAAGRGADLREWIGAFPPELSDRDPWLVHYRGVSVRLSGENDAAWPLQEQARDAFRAAGNKHGYAYALSELGTLACAMKRPAEAEQLLAEARAALGESDEVHQAAVLCALADAYVALNRLREAVEVGEEAVALTASDATSPIASVHVQALQRLALVRLREGRFAQALEVVSRALELGRRHRLDAETNTANQLILGFVRWGTGDLQLSDEVLSRASVLAQRHGLGRLQTTINVARGGVLTDLGRLDEAERLFSAGGDASGFFGAPVDGRSSFGWLRVLQNRVLEARTLFHQLLEEASLAGSAADVGRCKVALGAVALLLDRPDEAEQWLLDAARGFEASGTRFRLAGTHVHLADVYLARGDTNRCRRYLKLALDYATTAESYLFFMSHPATIARLAVVALREGLHLDYVETLCLRRLGAAEVTHFLPLLAERQGSVVAVARRIVDGLLAREEGITVAGLDQCTDGAARLRLTRAIVEGCLTARGLLLLRHQYRLTWAETDVFVEYYLTELGAMASSVEPERRALARRLAISENTLRHHITSVRQKLDLGIGRGSASVFVWALMTGIAAWPPAGSHAARN